MLAINASYGGLMLILRIGLFDVDLFRGICSIGEWLQQRIFGTQDFLIDGSFQSGND